MYEVRYPYMLVNLLLKLYVVIFFLSYICAGFDLELAKGSSACYFVLYNNTTPRLEVITPSSYFDSHLFNIDMHASL